MRRLQAELHAVLERLLVRAQRHLLADVAVGVDDIGRRLRRIRPLHRDTVCEAEQRADHVCPVLRAAVVVRQTAVSAV